MTKKWVMLLIAGVAIATGALVLWLRTRPDEAPAFASGNGRLEATEIYIATKWAGRVREVLVDEGDFVSAGQPLAYMDTDVLEAQRREAEADLQQAHIRVEVAETVVRQREAEQAAATAVVAQREAERFVAQRDLERAERLFGQRALPEQQLDHNRAKFQQAEAATNAAKAEVAASEAAFGSARAGVIEAHAAVDSSRATLERIVEDISDGTLLAPVNGRVQYRIAEPAEVLDPGGRLLSLLDLTDVYMTFFLPTQTAGRIAMGAETRIILDAAPELVIPAQVTFLADEAQFTPKMVETEVERLKLMFRVKAHIDPALLQQHIEKVKTGLPGVAHVRLDPRAEWPEELRERVEFPEDVGRLDRK